MTTISTMRSSSLTRPALFLALAGVGACAESTAPTGPGPFAPIQTSASEYEFEASGQVLTTQIGYEYVNRTGKTVSLVNCNGAFGLELQRWNGAQWRLAWRPVLNQCLSAPIRIEPGAEYDGVLDFLAGRQGSGLHPELEGDDPSGFYRIVWVGAVSNYNHDGPSFGDELPLEHRVSNHFRLVLR